MQTKSVAQRRIEGFVGDSFSEDPLGSLDDVPAGEERSLRFAVALHRIATSEETLRALCAVRRLPAGEMERAFPVSELYELHSGEITLAQWLDVQIPRLARAIEDKKAGRLPEVTL